MLLYMRWDDYIHYGLITPAVNKNNYQKFYFTKRELSYVYKCIYKCNSFNSVVFTTRLQTLKYISGHGRTAASFEPSNFERERIKN